MYKRLSFLFTLYLCVIGIFGVLIAAQVSAEDVVVTDPDATTGSLEIEREKARIELREALVSGKVVKGVDELSKDLERVEAEIGELTKEIEKTSQRLSSKDLSNEERLVLEKKLDVLSESLRVSSEDVNLLIANIQQGELMNEKKREGSNGTMSENGEVLVGKNVLDQIEKLKAQEQETESVEFRIQELELEIRQEEEKKRLLDDKKQLIEKQLELPSLSEDERQSLKRDYDDVLEKLEERQTVLVLKNEQLSAAKEQFMRQREITETFKQEVRYRTSQFIVGAASYIVAIVVLWILIFLMSVSLPYVIKDYFRRHSIRKALTWVGYILTIIIVIMGLFSHVPNFYSVFAIIGAGVAIALQDVLKNFVGFFFIIGKKGLRTRDRIEFAGVKGDVVDVGIFRTSLAEIEQEIYGEESTGRIISIPNNRVFTDPIINFSAGGNFMWAEVKLTITYESDLQHVIDVVKPIAERVSKDTIELAIREARRYDYGFIHRERTLEPRIFFAIADSGVDVVLRFLTKVHDRRELESVVAKEIIDIFAEDQAIDFAYPTRRTISLKGQPKPIYGASSMTPASPHDVVD